MDITIKLEEKNLSVDFEEQYRVEDVSDIGTVKIVMLKGEKGSKGDPGGEWSAYDLAPAIVDIASGNPVHITDGAADYPLTSAVIDIESTQSGSGDPSPSNVRPISGWTGAKLFVSDEEPVLGEGRNLLAISDMTISLPLTQHAINYTYGGDGWINATSSAISTTGNFITTFWGYNTATAYIGAGTYTLTIEDDGVLSDETGATIRVQVYGSGLSGGGTGGTSGRYFQTAGTYSLVATGHIQRIGLYYLSGTNGKALDGRIRVKLERGDTSTGWCPAPEDLATPATVLFDRAVTGGTLNALTGAMTVTKQMDTYDGSSDETWEKMSNVGSRRYFRGRISGQYYDSGRHGDVDVVANWLPTVSSQQDTSYTLSSVRLTTYTYSSNYLFILLGTDLPDITTVAEWRAYLAEHPLQVSYKIATAASMSVDPMEVKTLGGENYIWADCGEIDVEYKADTTARTSAARILDLIYPVGSVYTSVNDVSPATFIGGTWERFGAGRFLMGVDNGTSETTGGASSVTLQATQIPSHTHTIRVESPNAEAGIAKAIASSAIVSTSTYTTEYLNSFAGATNPSDVSILPPYVTVYFWKRTA